MSVRIEAGKIVEDDSVCMYKRKLHIEDGAEIKTIVMMADTRDELEIIDHENFRKDILGQVFKISGRCNNEQ